MTSDMSLLPQPNKPVIFDKETSGFKTKIELWSETVLRVSVYDHTCHMRFMHTFDPRRDAEDVFIDVMSRVKHMQIEYASEEWIIVKANREVGYRGN